VSFVFFLLVLSGSFFFCVLARWLFGAAVMVTGVIVVVCEDLRNLEE
jgi:hypothetical protein